MDDALSAMDNAVEFCNKNDWVQTTGCLQKFVSYEPAMRNMSAGTFLKIVTEVLKSIAEKLSSSLDTNIESCIESCATECFRCLRQVCALNTHVQKSLTDCPDVLEFSRIIINTRLDWDKESDTKGMLKCAVQFLGNACASNSENQKFLWKYFIKELRALVHHPDNKLCDYTCMVIHTCLTSQAANDHELLSQEDVQDIVLTCIQATVQRDMKWGLFVLEDLLKNDMFLSSLYNRLDVNQRLLMVELVLADVTEMQEDDAGGGSGGSGGDMNGTNGNTSGSSSSSSSGDGDGCSLKTQETTLPICPENIYFLASQMKQQCNNLLQLKTPGASDHEMALVIVKELEIVGLAASFRSKYPELQQDSELLSTAVDLLHNINKIGKSGNNAFTKVEKASGCDDINPHHPVFGLKKDLIRLIANMAYKHRKNQDLVRSLDGIPLLLDLTMIDCHNPYITQWVVLAIRNLLENNAENREVMTGMSLQGLAGHISKLRDIGVDTELRGGKIVVKPTKAQQEQPPK